MRSILLPIVLVSIAACAPQQPPQPGALLLSNPDFGPTHVEVVVTANPDCRSRGPGYVSTLQFILPNDASKTIDVPPGAEICWRRDLNPAQPVPGVWTGWDRAYIEPGTTIDANL